MIWFIWFVLIQFVSIILQLIGFPICAALAWGRFWRSAVSPVTGKPIQVWPKIFWLWSNDEDGVMPAWYVLSNPERSLSMNVFVWTSWRNSVDNLRFVPGVSGKGRPLWTYTFRGTLYHYGWETDGWPTWSRA